ncbi:MAG: hypothetical protein NC200_05990 [Candidatus Gastranaerophilales bacterium]|nr:hypothetical protein [Candidatus Gastranaerophilales bacterium]
MNKEEYWEKIEYNMNDVGMKLDVIRSFSNVIYQHIDDKSDSLWLDVVNSYDLLFKEIKRVYNRYEVLSQMIMRYKDMQ